ncbi:chemotaxis protein CheB [Chromobacterium haemolyticum]|uniref:protein-glutamate methylesterase n=2 Tax=Chromobacterium haemolyticum TaxID=394935 RepID=A0A1W0CPF9_9NEIS|nr:chemotaxis protein CheB [Chromobacterium haemolyticum]MBK0415721.1 chemotaxis protein CheB [Chromobacterium haemolyticum]MBO0417135.1 chemotaxis protein CheB [Chromobacterium haemolyticum]MBO0500154.1 chemotaxis protein CheB [Chromobacterium haemolyticum]OQS36694.1 chemotaxis protein CheB [Chromobacterium haemolyticum]OQS42443.1 chemotaxis protein CheB [Chromobacterium haemolyticum]
MGQMTRGASAKKPLDVVPSHNADIILPKQAGKMPLASQAVIVIGSSTGGTEALRTLLTALPPSMPPILITQHMPEMFTHSFATRLNTLCKLTVKEAEDNERLQNGTVYIAPGHSHLLIKPAPTIGYAIGLHAGPPVNRHRPSVDVLFRSAANLVGKNCIGVILTGMGRDGASGMLELKQAGAWNIAQDEASCVVFGMPKEAIAMGGAHEVLALESIATRLSVLASQKQHQAGGSA